MKKNKAFIIFQTAFAIVLLAFVTVFAGQAGTSDDPLVSKSYVDQKINEALNGINAGTNASVNSSVTEKSMAYTPVSVKVGQIILGCEGTELILRRGRGFATIQGDSGMVDVTSGTEIFDQREIEKNHLLIVPRDDGRGVRIVEDAWFLVKGGYKILN